MKKNFLILIALLGLIISCSPNQQAVQTTV